MKTRSIWFGTMCAVAALSVGAILTNAQNGVSTSPGTNQPAPADAGLPGLTDQDQPAAVSTAAAPVAAATPVVSAESTAQPTPPPAEAQVPPQAPAAPAATDQPPAQAEAPVAPPASTNTEEDTQFLSIGTGETDAAGIKAQVSPTNPNLISITLDDVEMVDVVKMFTRISGANIIASPSNLTGRVSVNLTDVEWKTALEAILDMHGLALIEKLPGSSVYSVAPRPAGAPEPMFVETVFLKYATVLNVNDVVKSMIAGGGSVSMFPSRNALVVRSTKSNIKEIMQVIEIIDILREQVYIEAKFIEITDTDKKKLGIDWQVLDAYNVGIGNLTETVNESRSWGTTARDSISKSDERTMNDDTAREYSDTGEQYSDVDKFAPSPDRTVSESITMSQTIKSDVADTFDRTLTDVRTAVLGIDDFRLILSALKTMDGVSVVSNPKIVVANEEPATIHIGQTERPFVSSVTPGQQGIAPVITYNPGEAVDTGVKLIVTPTVNTESNITVKIEPELTRRVGEDTAPNGQTYPRVARKKINTLFCLESGKTVAIGGLTETTDRSKEKKIPLLGNIPLIGKYLFSHSETEQVQSETIIFVTVGIAQPAHMKREDGYPEDTEKTKEYLLRAAMKKADVDAEIAEMKENTDARLAEKEQKHKARLMRRNK